MIKYIFFICFMHIIMTSFAQDTAMLKKNIDEITITATRTEISVKQLAQSVLSISAEKINQMQPQTSADLLQKTGLITVQKSQQGGGSPILRGLEANRVLLVVDGVRMNNIIFRGGHLQNVITVDPNILERAEVLFGPSSSVYGSDALGGVIHLITKTPEFKQQKKFLSNLNSRYSSVNQEKMFHYDLEYGSESLAGLFSVTYSDFGDLNGGRVKNAFYAEKFGDRNYYYEFKNNTDVLIANDKPWKQIATAYNQLDLTGKLKIKSGGLNHLVNVQYSNSSDIPRYDRLTDVDAKTILRNADWHYGPQKRFLANYQMDFSRDFPLKFSLNYQSIEESRHNRRVNNYNLQSRIENVQVLGMDLFHQKDFKASQWVLGLDGQYETVQSTAVLKNIITNAKSPLDTRYPGGFNHLGRVGAYSILTNHFSDHWDMQESIRLGFSSLYSDFGTNEIFKFPFQQVKQTNFIYSGNVGVNYTFDNTSRLGVVLASGFRVPNVDDLAKVFESVTGVLIVPNPDLKPEKSLSLEINFKQSTKDLKSYFNASVYAINLYDAIVTAPFKFNGSDSVLYNGKQSVVLANQNKRLARVIGFSLEGKYYMSAPIHLQYAVNYCYGRILNQNNVTPLDHIPPLSGLLGLEYQEDQFRLEFNTQFNGKKPIKDYLLAAEDNEVYATPEGMPAWLIFNLGASYAFTPSFNLSFGVENLMDTQYRVFASGINAPGRNIRTAVHWNF